MKVAAYVRVSTQMQADEGYSLAAQKERLKAFAFSQNWEIVQFYVDEGISAKDMDRPELQRMLKGVREDIFDIVLVYKLDRLTRSVIDLDKLLTEFSNHDVMFKSATEVYDTTTATGRLFIRLVASMAQWERENLGERVKMGMLQKAQEGKWAVSDAPFGYKLIEGELTINPKEAAVVKEIFKLYLKGSGMWKISISLNERGLFTRRNKPWAQNVISYVLTNPIYIGTMRYNYRVNTDQYFEIEGAAPPIISEDDFHLTQQIIQSRQFSHPRQATSKYLFSKVLKCARCGRSLVGKTSQSKRGDKVYYSMNYFCSSRKNGSCDLPMINENYLEAKFIELLKQFDFSQAAEELAASEKTEAMQTHEDEIKQLEDELQAIEKRRSKWKYAWVEEMLTDDDFKKVMYEENEKEKMIQKELEDLKPQESFKFEPDMLKIWTDLQENWLNMENETKKQFIQIAINELIVDRINADRSPESIVIKEVKYN